MHGSGNVSDGDGVPTWVERDRTDNLMFRTLLSWCLSRDSNCIDIGCHRGSLLSEIVRLAPAGRHLAFEPLPHLFDDLAHRFPDVGLHRVALSNTEGERPFLWVRNIADHSGFRARRYPEPPVIEMITVQTRALDSVLPEDYVPTLIKIDVEGAEGEVIEGALRTIGRHRPIVLFEHGKGAADYYGTGPRDVFDLICREARLRIFDLDGNGPYDLSCFTDTFERNERWNFVAHR
jgi:FkbM family methyltransferase